MKQIDENSKFIIDLTRVKLKPHVEKVFKTARVLAGDRPVNAGNALLAALAVRPATDAFSHLATLITIAKPNIKDAATQGNRIPATKPLYESFDRLLSLPGQVTNIWGRDYIAFALLAVGDPSLTKTAKQAGTTLGNLRKDWFEFVTSTDVHRKREDWELLWRQARVPIPKTQSLEGKSKKPKKKVIKNEAIKKKPTSPEDDPSVEFPSGQELLDMAYFLVLETQSNPDLLAHLNPGDFLSLLDNIREIDPKSPRRNRVKDGWKVLRKNHPDDKAPPFWAAWMQTVHRESIESLLKELKL